MRQLGRGSDSLTSRGLNRKKSAVFPAAARMARLATLTMTVLLGYWVLWAVASCDTLPQAPLGSTYDLFCYL